MKQIPLSQGKLALVDDDDFEYLSRFKWAACWEPKSRAYYARRVIYLGKDGDRYRNTTVNMHREIMGLEKGDKRRVDHRDPLDTLNNQKSNLRLSTPGQNRAHSRTNCNNKSGLKGVRKYYRRFVASIRVNGLGIHLGTFPSADEAHDAYCAAARKYHGQFARTN